LEDGLAVTDANFHYLPVLEEYILQAVCQPRDKVLELDLVYVKKLAGLVVVVKVATGERV
jgi:hypothetical protein